MNRTPNLYTLENLIRTANSGVSSGLPDGRWVPARPLGFYSIGNRIKCAWMVFTGRADAVVWPGEPQ